MIFSFQPVFWGTVALGWIVACLKSHRGPLVLLALAVTHARACLVTLRWIAARLPGDVRRVYPQSVRFVKEQE